jgi:hypothetical protein
MADEKVWKQRFLIYNLARLVGLATILIGMVIGYTDLVREGGWPVVGLVIAFVGAIDAMFAPRLLKKAWDEQDRQNP